MQPTLSISRKHTTCFILQPVVGWVLSLSIIMTACKIKLPEPPPDLFYKYLTLEAVDGPSDLLAKDLNLDGNLDIAIANMRANWITIYYGAGDGTFPNRVDLKVYPEPSSVATGDLNHDGFPRRAKNLCSVQWHVKRMLKKSLK